MILLNISSRVDGYVLLNIFFKYFPRYVLFAKSSPKLSGCFWLLQALMGYIGTFLLNENSAGTFN